MDRALEIARKCVATEPENDKFKMDQAMTLGMMARVESDAGQMEQARHFERLLSSRQGST